MTLRAMSRGLGIGIIGIAMALLLSIGLMAAPAEEAHAAVRSTVVKASAQKQSLAKASITLSKASYTYDGKAKKPSVTVRLAGKKLTKASYTVSYKNNTKAGTASVTVKGKGSYKGTVSKKFKIARRSLAKASVTLSKASYSYDGKEKKPTAKVRLAGKSLRKGTHYIVTYQRNVNAGTAKVIVTGTGNYSGSASKTFAIGRGSIAGASITVAPATVAFTGRPQKPAVTVRKSSKLLRQGTDYAVVYADNISMGTATVTVQGLGNYAGTATKKFKVGEPILRQWTAVSRSENGAASLAPIPASQQSAAANGFIGAADKTCRLTVKGTVRTGTWKLESAKQNARTYLITLSNSESWSATFYSNGELRMTSLSTPSHVMVLR